MKRSGFRKQTITEARAKQATKRQKLAQAAIKPKKSTRIPVKKKTLSKYKKELDAIFSKYIRQRDNHKCFTCDLQMEPNRSQNGHFVPRQYLATRFNEKNCHAQCYACNMLYNGQPSEYALRLEKKYGKGTVEGLNKARFIIVKLDIPWYQTQIERYKSLVLPGDN